MEWPSSRHQSRHGERRDERKQDEHAAGDHADHGQDQHDQGDDAAHAQRVGSDLHQAVSLPNMNPTALPTTSNAALLAASSVCGDTTIHVMQATSTMAITAVASVLTRARCWSLTASQTRPGCAAARSR